MTQYWTRFAHSGDPNSSSTPLWPGYEPQSDEYLSLAPSGPVVINDFAVDHKCGFWTPAAP
jgi:para-nitrobenzyl esterase